MRQRIRPSHIRRSAAFVAAAAVVSALPAVAAPTAFAEEGEPSVVISNLPSASPKPGEVYDESVVLTNNGTAAADGVTFRIRLTRGLDFPESVQGCTYSTVGDQVRQALCELDTVIEPGASIETPVRFKALPHALMEAVEYGTGPTGETPVEGFSDSYRRLALTADSTADLAAVGEWTEALAGNKQSVTVRLRNDGPGWIQNNESDDQPALMVQIPPGASAVEVPKDCAPFAIDGPSGPGGTPGKPTYVCSPADHTIEVGESLAYTFMLKIDAGVRGTIKGEVKATSVYDIHPVFDKNTANDKDWLRIDIPTDNEDGPTTSGGSSTGGGSTDGGSTTGGDGNDPIGQSTGGTGGTGGTGTTGSPSAGGSGTGTVHGNLASTGSDGTPLLAGAAAAAAALGGVLVVAVRRRRAIAKSS
ncbi:LPXTG cell wall anchor domain-containing protein [Streptomyces sp. ISL-22]|uniref:LPXTG cell wall anchor domain-containing protein n=1 Tax=unclassified Streptomyces TaxID=2593676 RepID=UPI001BE8AA06|nr:MULTISPECIES: LPXTG cell wall anchor domain-containing protein [unclassified Streptomyces]MBT2419693.1 LPXTG cell wall anchor domain-containing protein [Streptomyces sp. ISL-24]MBT2436458.1 LPXTG cell wall anchor domain-containing protein [Streptomyces sp. ISL-22]